MRPVTGGCSASTNRGDFDVACDYVTAGYRRSKKFASATGRRIEQIVQLAGSVHNAELEQEIAAVKAEIEENIVKQGRLSHIFTEGLLAIEAYKKQIAPLRDEERELKAKRQRLKLNLIEKEKSAEYQKLLKAVVNHFDYVLNNLDLAGKKGLMRLVFKNIVIKNGKIKSFEMYQPFQSMYEGAWLQWQTQMNQEVAAKPESVCGYKPSADHHISNVRLVCQVLAESILQEDIPNE